MRKKAETKKSTILSTKPSGPAQNTKPKKTMAKPQNKSNQRSVSKTKTTSSAANSNKSLSKPRTAKIAISPKKNNPKVNPALKANQKQGSTSNSRGSSDVANGSRKDVDNSSLGANHKQPADKYLVNIAHDVRINGLSSLLNVVQKATPKVSFLNK
jgi:hypothetical protein